MGGPASVDHPVVVTALTKGDDDMDYRVLGLSPASFQPLFDLSDDELAARGAARRIADEANAFPCRVSLEDAAVGEELLLLPFRHHDCRSPYQAAGPIYVRRNAREAYCAVNTIPEQQRRRLLSVRAYDAEGWMVGADVTPGEGLEALVLRLLANPAAAYLHVHNARPGCYACRIDRAS